MRGIWKNGQEMLFGGNGVSGTGVVTGVAPGAVTFTFTETATGCQVTSASVTVNPLPNIAGETDVCIGSTINLSPSTGGTWTSSNNSFATISDSGLVTGISAGAATFTFTETATGCQTTSALLTVNPLPIISGEAPVCVGSTINLLPSTCSKEKFLPEFVLVSKLLTYM